MSHEGDLWRWDGFVAAAHAPTGAARRLAERARLTEIEADMERARVEATERRNELDAAEAALKAASTAETAARDQWRAQQREADAARERHAVAEREIGRHAARQSALAEGLTRLKADRSETDANLDGRERRAGRTAVVAGYRNETRRRARRDRHASPGAAKVRAEAQALAREAELADRRLQAIGAERGEWQQRKTSAATQVATVETRITEAKTERAELDDAPGGVRPEAPRADQRDRSG